MKILVDVMGGDKSPIELLRGALIAAEEYTDVEIEAVGNEALLREAAAAEGLSLERISIRHAPDVITMEDAPMAVIREKNQSSMAVGLRALKDGDGDAFVSCGNTGALLTGGTLIVRRIKGIQRAAIGTVIPMESPMLLIDSGANLDVTPENFEQFAYMGSRYMAHLYGLKAPRVGQINNGTEPGKGHALQVETFRLLSASNDINFVGNIEAKALPWGVCDVLLSDGFTGNIILKYTEGFGKFFSQTLKNMFKARKINLLAALLLKKELTAFKARFDASEHGGAPLLGLAKTVIKAHGSSDAKSIKNAIRQAISVSGTAYMQEVQDFALAMKAKREATASAESASETV